MNEQMKDYISRAMDELIEDKDQLKMIEYISVQDFDDFTLVLLKALELAVKDVG